MTRDREEWAILLAVFLDLLGFGMLVADIQLRAEHFTPDGWPKGAVIGGLLASTFVLQLLVSPLWGRFSDHRGRKPVIVICTVLSALAMLVYGLASSIYFLLLSRILSGLGAANVAVAQAFISDRYDGERRTAALGRVGAAISTGLIVGPPLGGILSHLAGRVGAPPQLYVGMVAAAASGLGAIALAAMLPRVAPKEERNPGKRPSIHFGLLQDAPMLRPLVLIASVAWLSLATLEGTFARLIEFYFGYGALQFGFLFGYESLLSILVQGAVLAWILKRFRETPLLRGAYVLQGVGLAMNPAAALLAAAVPPLATLFVASTLFAFGSSIANPTVNGLCSRLVSDDRQGELFGLLQGTRSFGFVAGPVLGGILFDLHPSIPYILAGVVCAIAALLVPRWPAAQAGDEMQISA